VTPEPDQAESIAAAVLSVPGVARLHGGPFGTVATYLPGRSVTGVRLYDGTADIHVVLYWGASVPATAALVRELVESMTGTSVNISVEDVDPVEDAARENGPASSSEQGVTIPWRTT
jgi:uncharacterized alkaline shock family protein YloU